MSRTSTQPMSMLAEQIVNTLDAVVREAERETRPLEVDPYRSRLFELFVTAHGAGFLDEASTPDLTADALCRVLAERWGLADAARDSAEQVAALRAEHVGKMRLLWSLMRMWMEWTYAWSRWSEFHTDPAPHEPEA